MRLLSLSFIPLSLCTEPPEESISWVNALSNIFVNDDDADDDGYLSDFGEGVGLEDAQANRVPATPLSTTLQPTRLDLVRPRATESEDASGDDGGAKRPRVSLSDDQPDEDNAPGGEPSPRRLSELDEGRGFGLLAANPDIGRLEFVESLISSNRSLKREKVARFFYDCQKRTRFPIFVRDFLDSNRHLLDIYSSRLLTRALLPLYRSAGFIRNATLPVEYIRMWAERVLVEPGSHPTETSRGIKHVRLSRESRSDLFTRLWRICGAPPIPRLVAGGPVSSSASATIPAVKRTVILSDADRLTALELLEANPSWKVPQLVDAFLTTRPGQPTNLVKAMFDRFRGLTHVPVWMHEEISTNAHLAAEGSVKALIERVQQRATREGTSSGHLSKKFIMQWIQLCVPEDGSPERCTRESSRGRVLVRMPEDAQRTLFASIREKLVMKMSTKSS